MRKLFIISWALVLFFASPLFSQSIPMNPEASRESENFINYFDEAQPLRAWEIREDSIKGWLHWRTVENFYYGKDRGNLPMIADLSALHPVFRDKVLEMIRICSEKGIQLDVVETYRTPSKQLEYKRMGRRYTRTGPGYSRHQYGLAVDIVPLVNGVPQWNNYQLWRKIGLIGEKLGFRWGGRWRYLYDPGHFEYAGYVDLRKMAIGEFPPLAGSNQYPCLNEDLRQLHVKWKSLDLHQTNLYQEDRIRIARKESILRESTSPGGKE